MKKNMLKIFSAAVAVFVLATGCIQEIDPQTSTVTDEQAANAPGSFDNFVNAIESQLCGKQIYGGSSNYPWDYGYPTFYLMSDVMGQDLVGEDSNDWYSTWYSCGTGLGPQYPNCQIPWTYFYGWIKSCNTVISLAGEEPSESMMSGAGIAYAMRALFYLDLSVRFAQKTYGIDPSAETVPLVLESTSLDSLSTNARATNEQMFAHILSDLDKAETYLANYNRDDKYTPDVSVVYGIKARAYLLMEDWANAERYAKLAQQGYTPLTEDQYLDRNNGFNTPNDAWMFGCTFHSDDPTILNNDGDGSWGTHMIIEVRASGMGYGANYGAPRRIDRHLYSTIPDTDYRKMCFVDFAIDDMSRADAIAALSDYSDVPEGVYETGVGTQSGVVGGLQLKFRPKDGEHADQYAAWTVAVPIMRVEEMMLIEAEAAGMQDEARGIQLLEAFGKLRDPSYEYGSHTEGNGSPNATIFQNEVWWQRRVELWAEGFTLYDMKRHDRGVVRSYAGTNHPATYRWNYNGGYTTNSGNVHPDWMDYCIVQTETNYNTACTNNPAPVKPTTDSPEFVW